MNQGWIKLDRSFKDSFFFKNPNMVQLWIYILLSVNYKDSFVMQGLEKIEVKAGSFLTSRPALSRALCIPQTNIERMLDALETGQQIGQQKKRNYRIISIINWCDHEESGQLNGQQVDNKWTTSGQQVDTNKNIKKERKEELKEKDILFTNVHNISQKKNQVLSEDAGEAEELKKPVRKMKPANPTIEEVAKFMKEQGYNSEGAQLVFDYYSEKNWIVKGKKVQNWKNQIMNNWVKFGKKSLERFRIDLNAKREGMAVFGQMNNIYLLESQYDALNDMFEGDRDSMFILFDKVSRYIANNPNLENRIDRDDFKTCMSFAIEQKKRENRK